MKFEMAAGSWWWLLALFGATKRSSFLGIEEGELEVRFGPLFDQTYRFDEVSSVSLAARRVPWYRTSIGWRTNLVNAIGLISSPRNVVRIALKRPRLTWLVGIPVRMRDLYVSLEEPDRFLDAMRKTGVPVAAPRFE
jgi:hypothetical protein